MKKRMIRLLALLLTAAFCFALAACNNDNGGQTYPTAAPGGNSAADPGAAADDSVHAEEVTGEFLMTTADGSFTSDGGKYAITKAGTYSLRGALKGQVVVSAGEADEVILELNGTAITCDTDSPIKVLSADKVEISAKKGTQNVINDNRAEKTVEDENMGEGAIYSKADLKLKGTGTLAVNASYNNGVHCSKDLTIQKLALKVTAVGSAIKGSDSITVKSGTVVAISTKSDGIKTSSTDLSKSGEARGNIELLGGSIAVYSAGDGIQAAHDFIMQTGTEGTAANVTVFTGAYSGYTAEDSAAESFKGVKAANEAFIHSGVITVSAYDDGIQANLGTQFDSGAVGKGCVTITGGTVTVAVFSPEGKTGGGRQGPGHGRQQAVAGADGIHADGTLTISGGTINIDSAYEGLEANVINVSGGTTVITANDDGINACKGQASPLMNVTGGIIDVTVPANGDVDGIDSNGSYEQSGGLVITRGPASEMAAAIDAEAGVSVSGGTLIALGYGNVNTEGAVKALSLELHSAGSHTVNAGGVSYTFTNESAYRQTVCVSDAEVSAN